MRHYNGGSGYRLGNPEHVKNELGMLGNMGYSTV